MWPDPTESISSLWSWGGKMKWSLFFFFLLFFNSYLSQSKKKYQKKRRKDNKRTMSIATIIVVANISRYRVCVLTIARARNSCPPFVVRRFHEPRGGHTLWSLMTCNMRHCISGPAAVLLTNYAFHFIYERLGNMALETFYGVAACEREAPLTANTKNKMDACCRLLQQLRWPHIVRVELEWSWVEDVIKISSNKRTRLLSHA